MDNVIKDIKPNVNVIDIKSWNTEDSRILIKYTLRKGDKYCLCIGLNPSKANETRFDNTVINMINHLSDEGMEAYSGLYITNLLTVYETDSSLLNDEDYEKSDFDLIEEIVDCAIKEKMMIILFWGRDKKNKIRKLVNNSLINKIKSATENNEVFITVDGKDKFAHARVPRKFRLISKNDFFDCGLGEK